MTNPWELVGWIVALILIVLLIAVPIGMVVALRTRARFVRDFGEVSRDIDSSRREVAKPVRPGPRFDRRGPSDDD